MRCIGLSNITLRMNTKQIQRLYYSSNRTQRTQQIVEMYDAIRRLPYQGLFAEQKCLFAEQKKTLSSHR